MSVPKTKAEMTQEELKAQEEIEFQTGPLSVLSLVNKIIKSQSVRNHSQVLIQCRNNRKLLGRVKAL